MSWRAETFMSEHLLFFLQLLLFVLIGPIMGPYCYRLGKKIGNILGIKNKGEKQ